MVDCHSLLEGDIAGAVDMLAALEVSAGGVQDCRVYRALCRDAIQGNQVTMLMACRDGSTAGLAVAIIHASAYWRGFLVRHPLLACRILTARWSRRAGAGPAEASGLPTAAEALLEPQPTLHRWERSGPGTARILFIGVSQEHRGRGVAGVLYRRLADVLRERGLRQVYARIENGNLPSMRLHRSAGWKLYRAEPSVFAVLEL